MIDANTIKSLLKGVDVEWKKITDIFNIKNGYTPSKTNTEFWTDGDISWFRMEDIRENGRILNNSLQKINKIAIKGGKLFPANSIIISTSATIGEHALITIPYLSNQRFTNFSLKNEFKKILNIKFVYYYFFIFSENAKKIVNISSIPSVQMTELKNWNFPIPPLDVQNKIVNILDTFTALTTELTTELNARLKQYNYYRDKLLSFAEDEVEWKTLDEVGILIRGNGLQKKDFTEQGMPAIHYGQIYTFYKTFADQTKSYVSFDLAKKLRRAKYGDILIAGTSENIEDVMKPLGWFGGDIVISGDMFTFRPNEKVDTKYLTYLLQTSNFKQFKTKYAQGTKVIRVKSENFLKYVIPIPPLSKQKQIVEILDKFDALTNSITKGLPREIELRQKQYEYYRNLLLDFPKS